MIAFFDLLATVVSFIFGVMVFNQYLTRRKPYQLAWSIGLLMFAAASLAEALSDLGGWTPLLVKVYYLFGATLTVGYFALGSAFLLLSERTARGVAVLLGALTIIAIFLISGAGVDATRLADESWRALDRSVAMKVLSISINSIGSFFIIGGAIWSSVKFFQKTGDVTRVLGNVLIAAGVLVVASGGTLAGLLGIGGEHSFAVQSVLQAIGVSIMFTGFLQASKPPKPVSDTEDR